MDAKDTLLASVQEHSPQKANAAGKEKRASRNPNGRPPSRFKIRHTSTNGGKVRQTTALTYNAAMLAGLDFLQFDETGEVEIEDRELDATWRLV